MNSTFLTLLLFHPLLYSATKPTSFVWQPSNPLTQGLVRYYVVNGSASVVTDYASKQNLTCTGLGMATAPGLIGTELFSASGRGSCAGSDVSMPSGNSPWSFAAWVRTATVLPNAQTQVLFLWGTATVLNEAVVIAQYTTPQFCPVKDTFAITLLGSLICGTSTIADGIWHRVVATYDQSNIVIYVDGVMQSQTSYGNVNLILIGTLSALSVGGTEGWTGSAGDFAVWNRTLNATDVASDFADSWQEVRLPNTISCVVGGVTKQCTLQGLTVTTDAKGNSTISASPPIPGPQGVQGVQGVQGIQGLAGSTGMQGPIGMTGSQILCVTGSSCVGIAPAATLVANLIAPNADGTYTLSTSSGVGAVFTVVLGTVPPQPILPTSWTVTNGVMTVFPTPPVGTSAYVVWVSQ